MQSFKDVPLSDRTKEIILGSVLGDGSLKIFKGYKNASFQERHSKVQKDYLLWKAKNLKEIARPKSVSIQKSDGYSKNKKIRFISRSLPELTLIHNIICKKNKLVIQRRWLNHMSALSLAVWWCDDGSLISNTRKGVFCTDGFNKKSVQLLSKYFKKVWNITTIVAPVGRKRDGKQEQYWRLWIRSTSELKKFIRIIMSHIPVDSMLPKIILLYKDSQFQQRWISELVNNTIFSREQIEKYVYIKRKKWKKFRE